MSTCYCGKTTRPPLCDGSHWLSDVEYAERTEKLNKLFKKEDTMNTLTKSVTWVDQVAESIPEHCEDIAIDLRRVMSNDTLDIVDRHACALVAAICSGNGDLAYEISMSDELRGKPEREAAKTAAALITRDVLYSTFGGIAKMSRKGYDNNGGVSKIQFDCYLMAGIVTLRATFGYDNNLDIEDYAESVSAIAAVVGSIGKVAM